MSGSKLARLLHAVGGGQAGQYSAAAKNGQASCGDAGRKHSYGQGTGARQSGPGVSASATAPGDAPARIRKRRRGRDSKAAPAKPSGAKRQRREAGPSAKATSAAAAAGKGLAGATLALSEDAEAIEAERQRLLAGKSAYEALMDELSRARRDGGRSGGKAGGGAGKGAAGGGSVASLRAQLQRLRQEQLGESSEEEDEDEEGEGGEEEEPSGSEDGAEDGLDGQVLQNGRELLSEGEGEGEEEEDEDEEGEGEQDGGAEARKRRAGAAGAAANGNGLANGKIKGGSGGDGDGDGGSADGGSDEGDSGSDSEDDEGPGSEAAAAAEADGGDDGPGARGGGGAGPSGASRAAPQPDTWAVHVGRELTEAEAAELEGGRFDYRDALPAEVHDTAWGPNAKWQLRAYGPAAAAGRKGRKAAAAAAAAAAEAAAAAAAGVVALTALPPAPATLPEYGVKERLVTRWREVRQEEATSAAAADAAGGAGAGASTSAPPSSAASSPDGDFANAAQRSLFALLNSYADVTLPARPYPTNPAPSAPDPLLDAVLLHCLNHVAKTADRIKKNNHALQQAQQQAQLQQQAAKQAAEGNGAAGEAAAAAGGTHVETPRDQGFTRPKVLLLLPQRNFAFRAVRRLVALAIRETRTDSVQGKERFVEQFTDPEDAQDEEALDPATRARLAAKPAEHRAVFAGNIDDHFRLGIKVTKGAIRLFADLYQSDIIVASPLALATKLAEDKAADPHSAPDFLSSIELLVLDRADMMAMQNWAHVETVVAALNRLPRQQHGTDIMRVRDWYLAGRAGLYRQTVLLSSFPGPDANALARAAANCAGAARLVVSQRGVLGQVVPAVRQLFERFAAPTPAAAVDARFEFFMRAVWPRLKDSVTRGLLLFVPSYFDFLRLRNALQEDDSVDFAAVSEYSSNAEVTRARARFYHGQRRLLLYTERAHFYHRYRIRGIKDILFYGLPEHGHYYSELVNLLEEGGGGGGGGGAGSSLPHATVTALFCGWDVLALERVVGSTRARAMLKGESGTYMFC